LAGIDDYILRAIYRLPFIERILSKKNQLEKENIEI